MELDIYQVDAFTRGSFTGNPAAVIPLQEWLPDEVMLQIAEENNLSETAFFVAENGQNHIRWFTPTVEVSLCGHATLASAYVLFDLLNFQGQTIDFQCLSGHISVTKRAGFMTLDFPTDELTPVVDVPALLIKGLGQNPVEVYSGKDDYLCIFDSAEIIHNLTPDFSTLKNSPGRGILVSAATESGEFDFISRGFFPQTGINEDPATGSAHTTLTPYWSQKLGKTEMSACQVSERKGYFNVINKGERTLISGNARLYLKGRIYI